MGTFISTQEIVREMNGKVLGGAKIPHSCSFPVLRKVDGSYVIALFTQLFTREQMSRQMMQRPAYWCCAGLEDGGDFKEYNCKENDFCTAPYGRLYRRGTPARTGTRQDLELLYAQLDEIRKRHAWPDASRYCSV